MKILKNIKDVNFTTKNVFGTEMKVSEDIVMASAAGWYVGAVCKGEYGIEPFDRYTEYHETSELAQKILASEWYQPSSKIVPDTIST